MLGSEGYCGTTEHFTEAISMVELRSGVCGAVLVSGCGTEEPTPLGGDDASTSTPDAALRDSASGDATGADAGAGLRSSHRDCDR